MLVPLWILIRTKKVRIGIVCDALGLCPFFSVMRRGDNKNVMDDNLQGRFEMTCCKSQKCDEVHEDEVGAHRPCRASS